MMSLQVTLSLAAVLFCIGLYGVLTRRNAIGILLSIEVMANAANLNLLAFAQVSTGAVGQAFALFTIALTVTEVAVGLALVVLLYRNRRDILVDLAHGLKR